MINPYDITNFDRTEAELQEFLLFCMMVAGHNSASTVNALNRLLDDELLCFVEYGDKVFREFAKLSDDDIVEVLTQARTGKYCLLAKGIRYVADTYAFTPLGTLSIQELMGIPGVGPKTARFFIVHSRPDARFAVLDVHVLKWLKAQGYPYIRSQTPQSPSTYERIEGYFLHEADKRGLKPHMLDTLIWSGATSVYDEMKERNGN